MTLDTSAVVAILRDEPECEEFFRLLENASRRMISAVSVLEASMALEGRRPIDQGISLDQFLLKMAIEVVPFDTQQLAAARLAFRRFGKGRHPAGLNFGDCAAYALSYISGEPLLYKGADFDATDVARVRV